MNNTVAVNEGSVEALRIAANETCSGLGVSLACLLLGEVCWVSASHSTGNKRASLFPRCALSRWDTSLPYQRAVAGFFITSLKG